MDSYPFSQYADIRLRPNIDQSSIVRFSIPGWKGKGSWRSNGATKRLRFDLFNASLLGSGDDFDPQNLLEWGWIRWGTFKPAFLLEIVKRTNRTEWCWRTNKYIVPERQQREIRSTSHGTILYWLAEGGNAERYEVAFAKAEYERFVGTHVEPWTNRWFQLTPVPNAIRATSGHGGRGVCDEARGFDLPFGWVRSLVHGSKLAFLDSISANG